MVEADTAEHAVVRLANSRPGARAARRLRILAGRRPGGQPPRHAGAAAPARHRLSAQPTGRSQTTKARPRAGPRGAWRAPRRGGSVAARKALRVDEHETLVLSVVPQVHAGDGFEIAPVVGDHRTSLALSCFEDGEVRGGSRASNRRRPQVTSWPSALSRSATLPLICSSRSSFTRARFAHAARRLPPRRRPRSSTDELVDVLGESGVVAEGDPHPPLGDPEEVGQPWNGFLSRQLIG